MDPQPNALSDAPEPAAPKPPRRRMLWMTTAMGAAGVGGLGFAWQEELSKDPLTIAVLAIVVVVWVSLQARSWFWQTALSKARPEDVAEDLGQSAMQMFRRGEQACLPESVPEQLADAALALALAPGRHHPVCDGQLSPCPTCGEGPVVL